MVLLVFGAIKMTEQVVKTIKHPAEFVAIMTWERGMFGCANALSASSYLGRESGFNDSEKSIRGPVVWLSFVGLILELPWFFDIDRCGLYVECCLLELF